MFLIPTVLATASLFQSPYPVPPIHPYSFPAQPLPYQITVKIIPIKFPDGTVGENPLNNRTVTLQYATITQGWFTLNKIPPSVGLMQRGPGFATVIDGKYVITVHELQYRVLIFQIATVDGHMCGISQMGGSSGILWVLADSTVELTPPSTVTATTRKD